MLGFMSFDAVVQKLLSFNHCHLCIVKPSRGMIVGKFSQEINTYCAHTEGSIGSFRFPTALEITSDEMIEAFVAWRDRIRATVEQHRSFTKYSKRKRIRKTKIRCFQGCEFSKNVITV